MSEDEGQILGGCVVSLDGVVIGYDPNNPLVILLLYKEKYDCAHHRHDHQQASHGLIY